MAGQTVYDRFAERLKGLVHDTAREASPAVERWRVTSSNPLVIEQIDGGDIVLEEGDPDVEIDRAVLAARPAVGDRVRVHSDGADWIVAGVIA